jgi:hypothetical protein
MLVETEPFQNLQKMLGLSFQHNPVAKGIQRLVFDCHEPPAMRVTGLNFGISFITLCQVRLAASRSPARQ